MDWKAGRGREGETSGEKVLHRQKSSSVKEINVYS